MPYRYSWTLILVAALAACSGDSDPITPEPPDPPAAAGLLRDVVLSNLPSPYYHFAYDTAGRITAASFASGLRKYEVAYDGGRITEMREVAYLGNDTVTAGDRLEYFYDDAGRVAVISYVNTNGLVYTRLVFTYDGERLTRIERQVKVTDGFIIDKLTALTYYADGNLLELAVRRPAIDGQPETTTVDIFERYNDGINVDGFGLIHEEFFDHLFLLPGVQLQRGNPGRAIRGGDGINFEVDYSYVYDDAHRPRSKSGNLTISNGQDAGRTFRIGSTFSYY